MTAAPLLEVRGLRKDYAQPGGGRVEVLRLDSLDACGGEAIAVTGPSGSGKTTLLHILAGLIPPSQGTVRFGGQVPPEPRRSAPWRASRVGYVFQDANLLPDFDIWENLALAAEISGVPQGRASERARFLLNRLGLMDRARHRPAALSLGERQRAALARAVIHNPPLVLADEPTASLDASNAENVIGVLLELCAESRSLLLVATHDEAVKKRLPRALDLRKSGGAP